MENIQLIYKKIIEIQYSYDNTKIKNKGQSINLLNSINTNVKYNDEEKKSLCRMTYEIKPKDTNQFEPSATIIIEGLFSYDELLDKKVIHVEAAKQLYPYLKDYATKLFEMTDLSGLKLPDLEFSIDLVKN